jgi:hypothetical protein
MSISQNLLSKKYKYLWGLIVLSLISLICAAFGMNGIDDFDTGRREILLRRLGHELLLDSGDSTSRVLPVKKIAENEYQIRFEKDLTFLPDSLVNTTRRLLAKDPLTNNYIVNVLNCDNSSVAYGYAISENKKDDIVACIGREQLKACYMVNVKFKPAGIATAKNGYLVGSLSVLTFVSLIFFRTVKQRATTPGDETGGVLTLGPVLFDAKKRQLRISGNIVDLTGTETRILKILALSPNETIERSRLQKEIWEDEGIVVGRSLDMFISKLRKKLEPDPHIKIAVIRGKGYKLEINV